MDTDSFNNRLDNLENEIGREMEKLSRELEDVSSDIAEIQRQLFEISFNHRLWKLQVNEEKQNSKVPNSENELVPEDSKVKSVFLRVWNSNSLSSSKIYECFHANIYLNKILNIHFRNP